MHLDHFLDVLITVIVRHVKSSFWMWEPVATSDFHTKACLEWKNARTWLPTGWIKRFFLWSPKLKASDVLAMNSSLSSLSRNIWAPTFTAALRHAQILQDLAAGKHARARPRPRPLETHILVCSVDHLTG